MPQKECKDNKIRNPETGRCVNKDSNKGKRLLKKKEPCPDGQIRNPETGRCVNIDSNIGKNILKKNISCPEGQILNPKTRRCVNKDSNKGKRLLKKKEPCPEGKIRSWRTQRCVNKNSKTLQSFDPLNKEFSGDYLPDPNNIRGDYKNNKYYKRGGKKAKEILLNLRKSLSPIEGFKDYEKADYEYFGILLYLQPLRKMTEEEKKKERELDRKYKKRQKIERIEFNERLRQEIERTRRRMQQEDLELRIPITDIYNNFTNPILKKFKTGGG